MKQLVAIESMHAVDTASMQNNLLSWLGKQHAKSFRDDRELVS